ncbi:MAG: hypothetical protein HOO91_10915 [Bacteroidales bacterium]|nr:hypothetical protein [Bacteroidales bacterium]
MVHNISGKWIFSEEFECGLDNGFAFFIQNENSITGYLEYEEKIEDDEPFFVHQEISGTIHGNKISLKGQKALSPDGSVIIDYNLDTLEGTLTHEGKIVGHSFDSEDICGVFVLARETTGSDSKS